MSTIIVLSGYFNPIHRGHIRMVQHAKKLGDKVVVIVNNDKQQHLKKGKIIMGEDERQEVVTALRDVDEVILSIDEDRTVLKTLEHIGKKYTGHKIIFANGGDRSSVTTIPEAEVCQELGIDLKFGIGGEDKPQSSTNINKALGVE